MAIQFNDTAVQRVTFNGQPVQRITFNGAGIWAAQLTLNNQLQLMLDPAEEPLIGKAMWALWDGHASGTPQIVYATMGLQKGRRYYMRQGVASDSVVSGDQALQMDLTGYTLEGNVENARAYVAGLGEKEHAAHWIENGRDTTLSFLARGNHYGTAGKFFVYHSMCVDITELEAAVGHQMEPDEVYLYIGYFTGNRLLTI